jgi:hypothetical protein
MMEPGYLCSNLLHELRIPPGSGSPDKFNTVDIPEFTVPGEKRDIKPAGNRIADSINC